MQVETTALLIDSESLPSSLEEQLEKRDVYSEHAMTSEFAHILSVVDADLLVVSGESELDSILEHLRGEEKTPPLVVLAARATLSELRKKKHPEISALVPADLPVAAIAHRLQTMAKKSAAGRPLSERRKSERAPRPIDSKAGPAPAGSSPTQDSPAARPASVPMSPKVKSLAPPAARPSVPGAPLHDIKIFDSDEEVDDLIEKISDNEVARRQQQAEEEEMRATERKKREEQAQLKADKQQKETAARAERLAKQKEEAAEKAELRKKEAAEKAELRKKEAAEKAELRKKEAAEKAELRKKEKREEDRARMLADRKAREEEEQAEIRAAQTAAAAARPADDELSVVAPLPVNVRMPLAKADETLPKVRLALLDTDLTRADAVAAALREKGVVLHPVTPNTSTTRWPLLRRFAPQGLVVDEKSIARGFAEWVETFRGDLFLRHVPVILVRYSRLYREDSGQVHLEPLLPLVEHLGQEEEALLQKLGPGRQVDLNLGQVPPFRLVEMLTAEDRNTRLDCRSGKDRIVWHLGPGYAGNGKLLNAETDKVLARLSAEDAFTWMLKHEDCDVSVHEHSEPLAHASQSVDAAKLLRELTEAVGAPRRHQSVHPNAVVDPPAASEDSSGRSTPQLDTARMPDVAPLPETGITAEGRNATEASHAEELEGDLEEIEEELEPIEDSGPVVSGNSASKPSPQTDASSPSALQGLLSKVAQASANARSTAQPIVQNYEAFVAAQLKPLEGKAPEPLLRWAPYALPVVLFCTIALLIFGFSSLGSEDGDQKVAKQASSQQQSKASAAQPKATEKEDLAQKPKAEEPAPKAEASEQPEEKKVEEPDRSKLWKVAPDAGLATCEEQLGEKAPTEKHPIKAAGYWKNARRLLMVGKTAEAFDNMCLAGLYDPTGPAAEGLTEYYLGQRSLAEAERWVKLSLEADETRRKSHELLGDLESQKGNPEEAKRIWLKTMHLNGDETRKIQLTARKFAQDAKLAKRGGDLPRAERALRRAATLSPESATIAADLADVLLRRRAPEAAALWAAQALTLDKNFSGAMILSGRIAETLGDKDAARAHYESVPLGDPMHQQAQNRRSRL